MPQSIVYWSTEKKTNKFVITELSKVENAHKFEYIYLNEKANKLSQNLY